MDKILNLPRVDWPLLLGIIFLICFSTVVLNSIAPFLFPLYFLYIFFSLLIFFVIIQIDFEVLSLFSKLFYIGSVLFLILPLVVGQVSRGALRWIPIGALTIQPAEIVRPFLLIFFANFIAGAQLTWGRLVKASFLLTFPVLLILIQPSLGVALLTIIGFVGILLASSINKKYLVFGAIAIGLSIPLLLKILAPYQQARIASYLNPYSDPFGAGYNSIQSIISVGSGGIFGKGLGKGVQTQLAFLPEKHTDFIFASVAEELGFVGAALLLSVIVFVLYRLIGFTERSRSPAGRDYLSAVFLTLFVQVIINVGMNLGLLPITGLPLPLVSAGGSSLMATMISLAFASSAKK